MSVKQVFNTSAELDYPTVLPTLDLDFANSKTLDSRITFTRSSGGSYVGADGLIKYAGVNEARFDHDPSTGESLGLLIEESRQNIVLNSITLSSHTNSATTDTVTTETVSPDGTSNAYKVIGFSGVTTRQALSSNSFTMNANSSYTASVFLKGTATRRYVVMWFDATPPGNNPVEGPFYGSTIFIDLLMGTSTNSSAVKMVPYGNGWYRCSITATVGASNLTGVFFNVSIGSPNGFDDIGNPSIYKYVGDGTSGIYYWGPQVEIGAFPTSYIPTEASTRTRAADDASITGKNFSEWYRQDEYAIFSSSRTFRPNSFPAILTIDSGSPSTNSVSLFYNPSSPIGAAYWRNSGVQFGFAGTTLSSIKDINTKLCILIKSNDRVFAQNGSLQSLTTGFGFPPTGAIKLVIGAGDVPLNGTISRLTYYPKRLPNSQLQTLTS